MNTRRIESITAFALAVAANLIVFYVQLGILALIVCGLLWLTTEAILLPEIGIYLIPLSIALLAMLPITRQLTHLFSPGPDGTPPRLTAFAFISLFILEVIRLVLGFITDIDASNITDLFENDMMEYVVAWPIWKPWSGFLGSDPLMEDIWQQTEQWYLVPLQFFLIPVLLLRYSWLRSVIRKPNFVFLRSFGGKADAQLLKELARALPRGSTLIYLVPSFVRLSNLSPFLLQSITARLGSHAIPISANFDSWKSFVKDLLDDGTVAIVDTSHNGGDGLQAEVKMLNQYPQNPALWLIDRNMFATAFEILDKSVRSLAREANTLCYRDSIIGRSITIFQQIIFIGIGFYVLDYAVLGLIPNQETFRIYVGGVSIALFLLIFLQPATNYGFHQKLSKLLDSIKQSTIHKT